MDGCYLDGVWDRGREGSVLGRLYVLLLISLIEIVSYMGLFFSFQRKWRDHVVSLDVVLGSSGDGGENGSWMVP